MNSTKRMAAAIIFILFFGIAITLYTRSITKLHDGEESVSQMSEEEEASQEMAVISPAEPYSGSQDEAEDGQPATVGVVEGVPKGKTRSSEENVEAAPAISPLDRSEGENAEQGASQESLADQAGAEEARPQPLMAEAASNENGAVNGESSSPEKPYEERLKDLEKEAQKLKAPADSSNQYVLQNAAENEYKLWDGELNRIYTIILNALSREEAEALAKEEREWIVARDQAAAAAAKDSSGAMESVEYHTALSSATRGRVYELGGRYADLLME